MTVVAPGGSPTTTPAVRVGAVAVCGLGFGALQAASPLAFWWLDAATVYALGLVLIASVYIGFAVADGRWVVIAVEIGVASVFVVVAAAADHGIGLAARRRSGRPRTQGPLAAPKSVRREHTLVAAVLPRRRRDRRRHHRHGDRRRRVAAPLTVGEAQVAFAVAV